MTQGSVTVGEVLAGLIRRPLETLIYRWNWKAAVMSAMVRGTLFFITNLSHGLTSALGAMSIESAFYITVAGFYGALIESFRRARPAWAATLTVMVLMPTVNHSLELAFHWIGGTRNLKTSMIASVCFSIFSAVFNLFAMRRGVMIVGDGHQSLSADLRKMPLMIFEFLTVLPRSLWKIMTPQDRGQHPGQIPGGMAERTERSKPAGD